MALLICLLPVLVVLNLLGKPEAAPAAPHEITTILLMLGAAATYVCAQIAIVRALQLAEASFVSPMSFSQIIWAVSFELAIWGAAPELTTFLGVAIVILSNVYIISDARKRGAEEAPALHVAPDTSIPTTKPETAQASASSH
jgi:drug/metabolite transporter (DMT)-like permease